MNAPKIITIADTHLVFEYTISCWSATSRDKRASTEVENSKGAESGTASVNVHLLGKCKELLAIRNVEQNIRKHISDSLPPFGRGASLVRSLSMLDFVGKTLNPYEAMFNKAADDFVSVYPSLVEQAYNRLGGLLDLTKFPKPSRIREKFAFTYAFFPVPMNDFRVAPTVEAAADLNKFYADEMDRRLKDASLDAWEKLRKGLEWASNILTDTGEGKARKMYESSMGKFMGLTDLLREFNLTDDPKLEAERRRLEALFAGRTAAGLTEELKESPAARGELKAQVDSILSTLDFDL